jgi:hypothetical protein
MPPSEHVSERSADARPRRDKAVLRRYGAVTLVAEENPLGNVAVTWEGMRPVILDAIEPGRPILNPAEMGTLRAWWRPDESEKRQLFEPAESYAAAAMGGVDWIRGVVVTTGCIRAASGRRVWVYTVAREGDGVQAWYGAGGLRRPTAPEGVPDAGA